MEPWVVNIFLVRSERKLAQTKLANALIPPRALATSGRMPGVRAKRAARRVAGRQLWTGRREKTAQ